MPPSESAILRSGWRRRNCEYTSSVAQPNRLIGVEVIMISTGAAVSWSFIPVPDPMWIDTTVPSSAQAFQKGSQWSLCRLGWPSPVGLSAKLIAWQPFFATRRTSSAKKIGIPDHRDRQRDEAPRVGTAPGVDVPVVVRLDHHPRELLVLAACEELPAEAGSSTAKHIEPRMPHAFMSSMRSVDVEVAPGPELLVGRWAPSRTLPAGGPPRR